MSASDERAPVRVHEISIVVPVYRGAATLPTLIAEIAPLTRDSETPEGRRYRVVEVLLVDDRGPDDSARVIRGLEQANDFVRGVWLSRNFGQHPATLAGMASTGGDWVATLDEDGQHDPADLAGMLDTAMREQASVVYGKPVNAAPHGALRNAASKSAKAILEQLFGTDARARDFQSYRLMLGSIARSVAAYAGSGVYLDIAISWVAVRPTTSPITLRSEGRESGYSLRRLISHYWRMIISSGTRALRIVALLGALLAVAGLVIAVWVLVSRMTGTVDVEGWASSVIIQLLIAGAVMISLGVIAEYVGVAVNAAIGRPPYLVVSDPEDGPLGYDRNRGA